MITISDSIIDVPMASSSERVDIMPKNRAITSIVAFFSIVSTLPPELGIGTSMMLSDIVIIVYYKVFERSKSVGTSILIVNLCT